MFTKPKILVMNSVSPLVMMVLLEQVKNEEVELVLYKPEVDISDYDVLAYGGNCLPVLNEDQTNLLQQVCEKGVKIKNDLLFDSIVLLDEKPDVQKGSTNKTKTIANHDYPWYYKRNI